MNNMLRRFYSSSTSTNNLSRYLIDAIKASGPLSVARYMRLALTSPLGGYYMTRDVFGADGDFITSPEISQVFGELCGIYFISRWMMAGEPTPVSLVEFGPGRGTLMEDMLRSFYRFPKFATALSSIHLIEASPALIKIQHEKLCGSTQPLSPDQISKTKRGIDIQWHNDVREMKSNKNIDINGWTAVMMHEFLDAMPVYKFEKTHKGWREIMVDLNDNLSSMKGPFKFIVASTTTPALLSHQAILEQRYAHLKEGSRVEISPDSYDIIHNISKHLIETSGEALVIDYGDAITKGDTLRGIRNHAFINPLSEPGNADLTADVDFNFMKEAALKASDNKQINVFGPITQAQFLLSLGLRERTLQLVHKNESHAQTIISAAQRLIDTNKSIDAMGRIYKVLALSTNEETPIGFQ